MLRHSAGDVVTFGGSVAPLDAPAAGPYSGLPACLARAATSGSGTSGGATFNLPRYYSFNASFQAPAPAALPAGLALLALTAARRRR